MGKKLKIYIFNKEVKITTKHMKLLNFISNW